MTFSTGYWAPVIASNELGKKPIARKRFGQNLVFWRSAGKAVCMPDRCPHRGAALSLGRVSKSGESLACPFHGIEFAADGRCVHLPVEQNPRIPDDFRIQSLSLHEEDGFIWMWRGPADEPPADPQVLCHPATAGMRYGEATGIWNAHYSRCIENVCDFSHLPFVHRTTIGVFKKGWITDIEMVDVPGGFRAYLREKGERGQCFEFLYPNRWLLMLAPGMMLGLVFAPIDDDHTFVYGRTWYKYPIPGIKWLMDAYTRFTQYLVFREDWPIVASQTPGDVLAARDEKLFPSDAPVIAYRKLHRSIVDRGL
jgi:phenylpropionate dioxygenase-like ring-hydroxylating dioxygenase large terminal subunit